MVETEPKNYLGGYFMKKISKFLLIIGTTLLICIGVISFYQKSNAKTENDEYVPISHGDEIYFELPLKK